MVCLLQEARLANAAPGVVASNDHQDRAGDPRDGVEVGLEAARGTFAQLDHEL
jgi:hypothetical protein